MTHESWLTAKYAVLDTIDAALWATLAVGQLVVVLAFDGWQRLAEWWRQ